MKKQNQPRYLGFSFLKALPFLIFIFSMTDGIMAQSRIAAEIAQMQKQGQFGEDLNVFSISQVKDSKLQKSVKSYTLLEIPGLDQILQTQPDRLSLRIPYDGGQREFHVLLYKTTISPGGVTLITSDRGIVRDPNPIVHYRGCIENDPHSVVSFSFSRNETMGMISNARGDYNIGELTDKNDIFIIYNDNDLTTKNNFECGTVDFNRPARAARGTTPTISSLTSNCVKWYWEADYDIYVNKGSLSNANSYMQGIFNQVATLYANDGLAISLKTLFVWTSADPYSGPNPSDYLNQFVNNRPTWDGDLAHCINLSGQGGVAYMDGITACEYYSTQVSAQKGISGINATYNTVPTYSFTVECIAHEQGHQLGSNHTHNCVWNGNNTKIDDCGGVAGYSAGTCPPDPSPALPAGGGTIMSYCHLTSVGINFSYGFGPQPAALIAGRINNSTCLTACVTCPVPDQPAPITGSALVCEGAPATYSVPGVSGAVSYSWTMPTGWNGTSSTNSIIITPGSTSGNITVIANNGCGSSQSQSISVNVLPSTLNTPDSITGSRAICSGSTSTYSVALVTGAASYEWTLPSGWTGTSSGNSISVTAGTTGGTLSVKALNTCGSSSERTLDVSIITAPPAAPSGISGSTSVCPLSTQTYSVTPDQGATSYTWTRPNGWTGSSTTNTIDIGFNSNAGTLSVKANNSCGSSAATSLSISMLPGAPNTPGNISGATSICSGVFQIYSVNTVNNATSYVWTLPSGWSGSSTTNSINTTIGSASGTVTVSAANACGVSSPKTLNVTVKPAAPQQPGVISGQAAVCSNTQNIYSIAPVTNATAYTWTLPSGWTGTSALASITATAGTSGGTVSVFARNSCGSSPAVTLPVSVSTSTPGQPGNISGNTTLCQGISENYSISPVAGATSYAWTLPSGWTGTSITNSISATTGSNSGNISVSAMNSCGTGTARILPVTVSNAVPAMPVDITGSLTVCPSSNQSYTAAQVAGATSYMWTLPGGWTGTSSTNSINAITGTSGGNIMVAAANSCGTGPVQTISVNVAEAPAQPGFISGHSSICVNTNGTYSVNPVAGASSYIWTLPSGWSGTSTDNYINVITGNNGGLISVQALNTCGTSASRSMNITMAAPAPAQPGNIIGRSEICINSTDTYSVANVPGATSYLWTLPSGWNGSSTGNSIAVTPGTLAGNISVKAMNSCGTSAEKTLAITVSTAAPAKPLSISGNYEVCPQSTANYSVADVTGASSYLWILPSGWTGTSATNSITVTSGNTAGTIAVKAVNGCGASQEESLDVLMHAATLGAPGAISGSASLCAGTTISYSIPAINGADAYVWTLPTDWTGSSDSSSITAFSGTTGGNIEVTAYNNCGGSVSQTLAVNVSAAAPAKPMSISGNYEVCPQSTANYSVADVTGASSYIWTLPSGWSGTSTTNAITVTSGTMAGTIAVKAVNGCGASQEETLDVLMHAATLDAPGSISGSTSLCPGTTISYSIPAINGADAYVWTLPTDWTGSSDSSSITAFSGSTGGNIEVTAYNNCGASVSQTIAVNVNAAAPDVPGNITGNQLVCEGSSFTYSIADVQDATGYIWTLPAGWSGSSTASSITVTAGNAGGNIEVRAQNGCGISNESLLTVSVNSLPAQPVNLTGNSQVRPGTTEVYSVDPVPGATYYVWTLPQGWTGSSNTNTITVQTDTASGYVSVTAYNDCGAGQSLIRYINTSTLLPVTLLQFTGQRVNESVILNWTVTSEINCHGYDIERSSDARSFQAIGFTAATGNASTVSSYRFPDNQPLMGTSYYRLKILDNDGQFSYSNIVKVNFDDAGHINVIVYPNPAIDQINVKWVNGSDKNQMIRIYNSKGQKVKEQFQIPMGQNSITTLPLRGLASGNYILTIGENGRKSEVSIPFIKVK